MADSNDFEGPGGETMTDAEVEAFLAEQGTGVLGLASGGEAYAVPISFGYREGRVGFVYWQFGAGSEKRAYSEATERACLTVYEVDSPVDWRSVMAFGPLREVPPADWGELGRLLEENAWSPDLSALGDRRLPVTGYELTVETATGLRGSVPTGE